MSFQKSELKMNSLTYCLFLILTYILFSIKYSDVNLFQHFELDFLELQNLAYQSGSLTLDLSKYAFLKEYAFNDTTYTSNGLFINTGNFTSILYLILDTVFMTKTPKVPLLVVTIAFFFFNIFLFFKQLKCKQPLLRSIFSICFLPFPLLIFETDHASEIATWFALCFTLVTTNYFFKYTQSLENKDLLISLIAACIVFHSRLEFIPIIGLIYTLLIFLDTKLFKRIGIYKTVLIYALLGIGVFTLNLKYYLLFDSFFTLGDDFGRLHTDWGSYWIMFKEYSFSQYLSQVWLHITALLGFINAPLNSYNDAATFKLGDILSLAILYFWVSFIALYYVIRKSKFISHKGLFLLLPICQFFVIGLLSETFFNRYILSYITFLILGIGAYFPHRFLKVGLATAVLILTARHYLILPINPAQNTLKEENLIDRAIKGELPNNRYHFDYTTQSYRCDEIINNNDLAYPLKGIFFKEQRCLAPALWVKIAKTKPISQCNTLINFDHEINCSELSYYTHTERIESKLKNITTKSCEASFASNSELTFLYFKYQSLNYNVDYAILENKSFQLREVITSCN